MTPKLDPGSKPFAHVLTTLALCAAASSGSAQVGLTPDRYFECHIAAKQASAVALQERYTMLSQGQSTNAQLQAAAESSRNRVSLAFSRCGYTAGTLGAYAYRNADALKMWLDANPKVQARLDAESQRIATLSAQMPAVSPSAMR